MYLCLVTLSRTQRLLEVANRVSSGDEFADFRIARIIIAVDAGRSRARGAGPEVCNGGRHWDGGAGVSVNLSKGALAFSLVSLSLRFALVLFNG